MLRSRSLDLSFIRRAGRKRSAAIRSVSQAFVRSTFIMAAVSSTADLAAPSKRSRGLADIDPKFVSNSGLSGPSELECRSGSVRIQHRPPRHPSGSGGGSAGPVVATSASAAAAAASAVLTSRFPKLDECAHFHYDNVDLGPLSIQLYEENGKVVSWATSSDADAAPLFGLQITSYGKTWILRRSYEHFRILDEQLHRCIYDRKFSQLPLLPDAAEVALKPLLSSYVNRLSAIAGNLINCAPVLNWLEVDNRGRRLYPPPPSDDADAEINTPAVAAAYAVRRYAAVASDEISFEVGDMISVIDMPPPEESMWWRGKRGFDVGFFPSESVRLIGDKVPAHLSLPGTPPPPNPLLLLQAGASSSSASGITSSPSPFKGHNISGGSSSGGGSSDHLPTKPVLRKHGKLISFFRSFILSRPSRRKLKQSGILKERVFGCDLGEHLLNSGREIPMVLKCCAEFIEEYGIVDGIYRLSGITSNIQKLRNAFDEDRIPALVEDEAIRQDMHAVSSLLKMYFRELPNPLCTYQLYDQFVNAVQGPDNLRVIRMREVVQQLPPPHFRTLEYLTRHLARVAENNASTGMTAKNVAIVWAPNLLRCKELEFGGVAALQGVGVQAVVTECLVRYVELIFSDKAPLVSQLSDEFGGPGSSGSGALKRTRPKSLAISTPTKLLSLEEARNRALQLASSQNDTQYIEVGGGPSSLPPKYHTVIELPGGHAAARRGNSLKHKKSPLGWKSLFAKPKGRSATITNKAQRKGSSASTSSTASMPVHTASATQRAITYIRPRLRPVKSAESLVPSNRNSSAGENSTSPEGAKALETVQIESGATAALSPMRDGRESVAMDAGEGDDDSQDGTLSRCHNRSVSHDSYFRLMMSNRAAASAAAQHADTLDEESEVSPESNEERNGRTQPTGVGEAIYAEISKPSTSKSKQNTPAAERSRNQLTNQSGGTEFGRDMNLTSVEDPHSGSSKLSLNDLSHLDDSELNMMSSREMLASTTSANNKKSPRPLESSSESGKARRASVDDSIIDDSARIPLNAEQIDERGNWAASNPAYELFCIQAEVHNHNLKFARSPSPDNTDAQMPDMPSEMAMDGDSDSLVNVGTEDYSSTEQAGSDEHESGTLGNITAINDLYENVNVAENRSNLVDDSSRKTAASPSVAAASAYESFAENHAYAMVRVAGGVEDTATYENVIDPSIIDDDEEYEPIQPPESQPPPPPPTAAPPTTLDDSANFCYENIDQPSYENLDEPLASYENVNQEQEQSSYENIGALTQPSYENLDRPQATQQFEQPCYENVGDEAPVLAVVALVDPTDVDQGETYENVVLRTEVTNSSSKQQLKASLELVNVYEDVVPPPPKTAETEEIVYHQVKVLRQSIQEVNQLLRDDPTVLQMAIEATSPPPPPSPVKYPSTATRVMSETQEQAIKKKAIAKDSTTVVAAKAVELVIRDIAVDDPLPASSSSPPSKGARFSLTAKQSQTGSTTGSCTSNNTKDHLSLSLPSLLNSPKKSPPTSSTSSTVAVTTPEPKTISSSISSRSLPPTPLYELRPECESISSKRRFESEIGRDLLRERRIRNEIESSRRSDGSPEGTASPLVTSPIRRVSSSASSSSSSSASNSSGRPALPVKTNPKRSVGSTVPPTAMRPTTLETSFDYEPSPLQRRASSPPSSGSPLSPVSPSSEGRNARKASVKELLNKFQTGNSNNEQNDRSTRVTTPTSPINKPTPTVQSNKVSVQSVESDAKMNTKDGKENIEVHFVSLSPPAKSVDLEAVTTNDDSLESNKSVGDAGIEQDAVNDLLRGQKSLSIGIDMTDPRTRLRIERYKEERRSFLREKYKSESFRSDSKEDGLIVRLKQKAGSPTHQPESNQLPPPPSLQSPEPGLIDEDVNVKERAAHWAGQTVGAASSERAPAAAILLPSPPTTIGRSCSEAASSAITPQQKRIRDMAALFEKESP